MESIYFSIGNRNLWYIIGRPFVMKVMPVQSPRLCFKGPLCLFKNVIDFRLIKTKLILIKKIFEMHYSVFILAAFSLRREVELLLGGTDYFPTWRWIHHLWRWNIILFFPQPRNFCRLCCLLPIEGTSVFADCNGSSRLLSCLLSSACS